MSLGEFVLARPAAASCPGDAPRSRRFPARRAMAAWTKRTMAWLLPALEAHTRRQIALALGERVAELNPAVRANRARETANVASEEPRPLGETSAAGG